ncbi:uncharacterized protein PV07_08910 [Cladophialophora immunda]|uniref:Protein kinase domain-containing protein n=1 Tax=Cladophialophora immunda TaxID=569365 RepID=A0A0D2C5I9_9EURO|nr:uncharacterized protein PV07_08910 [Cladophialophora immunda]KIW25755.1 hypothetical protein PV07_08910 [Cladophialophora immunda]
MIPSSSQAEGLSSVSSRPDCAEQNNNQNLPNKRPRRLSDDQYIHPGPSPSGQNKFPTTSSSRIIEGSLRSNQNAPGIKIIFPQHTEETFGKYTQDQGPAVVPMHREFSHGDARFTHIGELGRGSSGTVDKVEPSGGIFLPGKIYARKAFTIRRRQSTSHELALLDMARTLLHPNILTTIMTYEEERDAHSSQYGIILNPVADCTLRAFLEREDGASDIGEAAAKRVAKWLGCLGSGLSYLHAKNLIHRRISPLSILIRGGEIFFAEFAISNHFKATERLVEDSSRANAIWEVYQAPEAQTQQLLGTKADIFSLGCVFIELLTSASRMPLKTLQDSIRQQPFPTYRHWIPKTLDWLAQIQSQLTLPTLRRFSPYCENMLKLNPSTRPSAFAVTRFLFDSNPKLSEGFEATKSVCDCLLPWLGKFDEQCRVLISLPETSRSALGPDALLPPGRYQLPTDSLTRNKTCSYCPQTFDNPLDVLFHVATQHRDKTVRDESLVCTYGECAGRPPFLDERQYEDHQHNFHREGFPQTSDDTRQGTSRDAFQGRMET